MVSRERIEDLINQARTGPIRIGFNSKLFVKNNIVYGTDCQDDYIDFMANLDEPCLVEAAYCWFNAVADEVLAPN